VSRRPLDFNCYLCGTEKGAFCVTRSGATIDPHKVRVRAAQRGEEARALKARSTVRVRRLERSRAGVFGGRVRADRMREATASLPPKPEVCPSKPAELHDRPKGACINCDKLGHNARTCPLRGAR
jgi:hypothetical protein